MGFGNVKEKGTVGVPNEGVNFCHMSNVFPEISGIKFVMEVLR